MKSHSKTILYKDGLKDISDSTSEMVERCKFALFKLSFYRNLSITLKYTNQENENKTLLRLKSIASVKNKENDFSNYIIDRINLGLDVDFSSIKTIFLTYEYVK